MFFTALVFSLGLYSNSLYACTDFSGEFYSEVDGTYFTVFQIGCESVQYSYDNGDVFQHMTDGNEYVISDVDSVDSDGNFEMNTKIFETNKFDGHKLKTSQREVATYSNGTVFVQGHKSETFLNKANDMVVIFQPEDSGKSVKTFKRAL